MEHSLHTLLHKAIFASLKAAEEILKVYDTAFDVEYKNDNTPLTLADKNASDKIIELLSPFGIPVLSEEGEHFSYDKRKNLEYLWVVDPLDGTKEFVKRNGEFTVNIALIHQQKPILGVIYSPVFKNLYFASKETGAFKLNDPILLENSAAFETISLADIILSSSPLPIQTQTQAFTIVASRSHLSKEIYAYIEEKKIQYGQVTIVNTGSSIKMCWVAEGIATEYPRFGPTMEWDTAAGQAILENSGCELIDLTTNVSMVYNREELLNNWFSARRKD